MNRLLLTIATLLMLLSTSVLAQTAPATGKPAPELTLMDISKPFQQLPAVTPQSSPQEISTAIQSRLDWLQEHRQGGRIYIPEGTWQLGEPIFTTFNDQELTGAGVGKTVLKPAPGMAGMGLVHLGARLESADHPLVDASRVSLTTGRRVLDESVQGERFGLRTYGEFPNNDWPATSHLTVGADGRQKIGDWKEGTAYKPGDVVKLKLEMSPGHVQGVCTAAHTAGRDNQPSSGKDWQKFWVLKLGYHVAFQASPLSSGAYNPQAARATNWQGMDALTIDFAFVHNVPTKTYGGTRVLLAVMMSEPTGARTRVWNMLLDANGTLRLGMTTDKGVNLSPTLAKGCSETGLHRISVQIDFKQHRVQAWVQRPGETSFARSCDDAKSLAADSTFMPGEYSYFVIGASGDHPLPHANYEQFPLDVTVAGLHLSASLRYADEPTLQDRQSKQPTNDASRYFANDKGTLAFLPLTEKPGRSLGSWRQALVHAQHGDAAGDATQQSVGYFMPAIGLRGVGRFLLKDMTLQPGKTWGAGVLNWHTLGTRLWNVDIRGGFYGVGDMFFGAQYTFDVRDCTLSGSEAAWCGMSNIMVFRNVTVDPVGRFGMLLSGSNPVLENVTFKDPQTHQSEWYFRHIPTAIYGGMNTFDDVRATAPAGSKFPSRGAFHIGSIPSLRTTCIMRDVEVANMGPRAVFLDLPFSPSHNHCVLDVQSSRYSGSPIASFVRTDSAWWSGPIRGFDPATPVGKWIEQSISPLTQPWKPKTRYGRWALVVHEGKTYQSQQEHQSADTTSPTSAEGAKLWKPVTSQIVFQTK